MTMRSPKMVYAQSSDIRSRTYLEYRSDMKKKGIAELEFLPYKIVPRTLEGFYQVCYLLDKLGKEPDTPGVWMVYLLTFFRDDMRSIDFARFMYALDFLYFKCADIKRNETQVLRQAILDASDYVRAHAKADGTLAADPRQSPLEETRRLIFAVNLLEDIRQDAAVSFGMELPLVANIFETIPNAELTANYVRDALRG